MSRHTGMCRPNGLLFHQKSLHIGPILSNKSLEEGPITHKLQKNCKISHFWGRKSLRNGSRFAKKFENTVKSAVFWGRKILRYGYGFQTLGCTPCQKINRVPPASSTQAQLHPSLQESKSIWGTAFTAWFNEKKIDFCCWMLPVSYTRNDLGFFVKYEALSKLLVILWNILMFCKCLCLINYQA